MMLTISPRLDASYMVSSVVFIDLSEYVFAISESIHPATDKVCLKVYEKFSGISGAWIGEELFDKAFKGSQLSKEIMQLPIYRFLFDAYVIELIRNAMDECLMAYFESGRACQIEFTFGLNIIEDDVFFEFKDNGRGFPEQFLIRLSDNTHKAEYLCGQDSFRRENRIRPDIKTFGGQGVGLRQLISWVQCGLDYEVLRKRMLLSEPKSKQIIFENMASNFNVEFLNVEQGGALVRVKVPKSVAVCRDKFIRTDISEGLTMQEMQRFFGVLKKPFIPKRKNGLTLDLTM